MLVLTRREGQSIYIGDNVEVVVLRTGNYDTKLGFKAPEAVRIVRKDYLEKKNKALALKLSEHV